MIDTEGLTHLHLFVADLGRSPRFYREAVDLQEMFRDGPSSGSYVGVRPASG